ncbi:MAG: hypothetical protein GYA46_04795 [candidate division Zixibacteria bacterium]|nr:hypothetical protein [candidate division Zixibacteria bacterium]
MGRRMIDEGIGWYGMVALLAAFALNSFGIIGAESLIYLMMNLTGALGIAYISFKKKAYQPGILDAVWAAIALVNIIGISF